MAFITAATRSDIVELAMGMLNQAPSTTLLNTLIEKSTAGSSIQDLADYIATTDAFIAEYPSTQTAREFATEMFGKLITGGTLSAEINTVVIDLLEGMLTAGTTKAEGFVAVIDYLSNSANNTNADLGDISKAFQNRADAAEYFSITKELGDSTDAELAAAISTVTSDAATLTAANAAADTTASAVVVVAGESYSLTTALDSKTLGAGDDQAFAVNSDATAASDTFNVADLVDGGAGEDTFTLTVNDLTNNASYTPSRITNFEALSITNVDNNNSVTVDATLMGLTSVNNSASAANAAVIVTGVTAGASLSASGAAGATTLTVLGAGLTGTEDTATISLTGNTGDVNYTSSTAQDIEKAAITVTGVNTSALTIEDSGSNGAVTTVTVDGSGSYDMETGGNIESTLETLDASANTGGVTFTGDLSTGTTLTGGAGNDGLTGGAGNDVIKGGAGEDTLAMGSGGTDDIDGGAGNDTVTVTGLTTDDSIVGGDGVDTLSISAAIAYDDEAVPTAIDDAVNISGFEILRNTASITQDMAAFTGIVAAQSTVGVLTATEASGIADYYALASSTGLDMTLATDGTADNLNIHLGNSVAQTNAASVTIDAIETETALIASGGADSNSITDFEADSLTALTITGSKSLAVTLNDSAAVSTIPLTKVDASAFTGSSLSVTAVEADSGVTVTTGSQALTVTVGDGTNSVTATAGDDNVTTGSGADTIVTYDGEDTISAGDGANTITVGNGNATITGGEGVDTVTAGTGNNVITLGDGADVLTTGKGANTITNAAGNATITAGDGNNTVTNTAGNSTITLGGGTNTVNLTAGNSTVVTGEGADDINITAGNNDITSGAGNDTISLGSGNDTVDAGTGTDAVDFSISSGTWTGAVSNAETVSATFTGSAKIDTTGITGYTSLTVAASADTTTTTINNLATSTLNLTDDAAEAGGDGDLEAVTVDAVDDAALVISLGANQEAATATASVLGSLTVTDAASVTLKSTGGSFGNLLENDFEAVALDDNETTTLVVEAASNYSSIATAAITGSEGMDTLTITASGTESDVEVDTVADATNLSTLSITASGLNSQVELGIVGNEASTTDAILSTLSIAASNAADIDFAGTTDGELGDINTVENMTSAKISATGAGSTVTAGEISADGLEISAVELEASAGGVIDMETVADALTLNYSFDSLTLQATGVNSSLAIADLTQDAGSLAGTAEATLTIEADDYATIALAEATLGAVDLDTLHIGIGNGASITGDEADISATGDIGNLDIDMDANSTHEGSHGIGAGKILGTLSLNIGDEAAYDAEAFEIVLTDDVEAMVGVKVLNIDIADQDGNATTVDLETTELVTIASTGNVMSVVDSEADVATYYSGSITIRGNDGDTVIIDEQTLLGTALPTAGSAVYGSWGITTGDGGDTITGSRGADTVSTAGGADNVTGGAGNDSLTVGNGADTVSGGAGNDSIVLTESVSSADVILISSDVEAETSDSGFDEAESGFLDRGQDTITAFTAGVDTIQITSVGVNEFVHGTDTDLGLGTATGAGTGAANFGTNVGIISLDGETGEGVFNEDGDILINFSSPTTTMTEALLEAALSYVVTGTANADTITTGALADTITITAGNDVITAGGGADTIAISATLLAGHSETSATIAGGTGTDIMSVTGAATLIDADFRGMTSVDTLTFNTGDSTITAGDLFAAAGITGIDQTGAIDVAITQETGQTIGTASAPLQITGYTFSSDATIFDALGTDAASTASLTGFTVSNGAYSDADGTAADFFTKAAAGFAAGGIGLYVVGGDTFVFAEGAATTAGDDVYLQLIGVTATSVSATSGAAVFHFT